MKFLTDIRILLLCLWLGAAVFFIGVAQSAFAVLPSRDLAGSVVNRTLMIVNFGGLGIGAFLLLTSLIAVAGRRKFWVWVERLLLVVVTAACAVGQFVIALWLQFTKAQMGGKPIDEIAADDPLRIQFNNLHEYSVWVLVAGMAAALFAFFVIANTSSGTAASGNKKTTNDPFDFSKEFVKK